MGEDISPDADIDSDHNPVVGNVCAQLKTQSKTANAGVIRNLLRNFVIKETVEIDIDKRLNSSKIQKEMKDIEGIWHECKGVIKRTMTDNLTSDVIKPKKKKA